MVTMLSKFPTLLDLNIPQTVSLEKVRGIIFSSTYRDYARTTSQLEKNAILQDGRF